MKQQKNTKFFKKCLSAVKKHKIRREKEALKAVLSNMRTDSYDKIPAKDLMVTADNYRLEALALLEAVYWLFGVAEDLDKRARNL